MIFYIHRNVKKKMNCRKINPFDILLKARREIDPRIPLPALSLIPIGPWGEFPISHNPLNPNRA
jgi:hypothetical protein